MGVTETLRIFLAIFLSTACIQNVRLFGVYDVRWPFLAEIHTAPLKRFVTSSVLQAVRALRNAPAASAVFLAGVAPVVWITARAYARSVIMYVGIANPRWRRKRSRHSRRMRKPQFYVSVKSPTLSLLRYMVVIDGGNWQVYFHRL